MEGKTMIINTNMASINAQNNLRTSGGAMQKSLEKLSSGYRINRAADDAAGLAISEKMRGQIRGTNQALRNAQDGISMLQTAEGGMSEIHSILQRMRELAVQSSNDTLNDTNDREGIQKEFDALTQEIDRIASSTNFNTKTLLDGGTALTTGFDIQVGANSVAANDVINVKVGDMTTATGLSFGAAAVDTLANAKTAITTIDNAINKVAVDRADIGANQNRLEHAINNLAISSENLTAAESRIRDVDMAKAMSEFTKNQILNQAGVAMLAQANQTPQAVLKLLG